MLVYAVIYYLFVLHSALLFTVYLKYV